ncbi:hypothetical protein WSK_1479 [Novosphingobium sp. Rr 2-17]|uniref:hypothetical protein n=1 Tax=Novosphingobium sp. Rr 2-17 TaxID=555793 RepID=UPI00026991B9|nr:hypothetical protein [Novosphingobium sp. Rr 2-17]EIZ79941.1 hypothetical protein WSK_1479 [Novosphingobium sp. Rr 2-17]
MKFTSIAVMAALALGTIAPSIAFAQADQSPSRSEKQGNRNATSAKGNGDSRRSSKAGPKKAAPRKATPCRYEVRHGKKMKVCR